MTVNKPYTFTAGTKARAEEVNTDFDVLYTQVNTNISNIARNKVDIESLDANKADLHGSASNKFAVGNPDNASDAMNKQTFFKQIANTVDYIGGLTITKSNSNTIIVDPGACYDREGEVILKLDNSTSKQNTSQVASTTYYVYLVSTNADGSNPSIVIDTNSVQPGDTPPSKYRHIGTYKTNGANDIESIITDPNKEFDGQPVNAYVGLNSSTGAGYYLIDLYDYLPHDGSTYMIYLVLGLSRVKSDGDTNYQTLASDIWYNHTYSNPTSWNSYSKQDFYTMPAVNLATGHDNNISSSSRAYVQIPAKRYIMLWLHKTANSSNVYMVGYRRIGTNT